MAESVSYIFQGLTLAELQAIKAAAITRITDGDNTSLSGQGHSSSWNFAMSPLEVLREVNFAINALNGTLPPTTTYADFRGLRRMPNTVTGY